MSTIHNIHGDMAAATVPVLPADEFAMYKASSGLPLKITNALLTAGNYFAGGSTLTLVAATHGGATIKWDTLAGSVVTLPTASGSGVRFRFLVTVLATSNSHVVQAAGSDLMVGVVMGYRVDSGNAVLGFSPNGSSHKTCTLNRTTTGSVSLGEWINVEDIATNRWHITGMLSATGAAFATPFS